MNQSSLRMLARTTLVSPRIDSASPCSIASPPSVEKSVCGETHACRLPSSIALPFCTLSMCGFHIVPDFADFSPMAKLNFLWNDIDGESFSSLVKSCYEKVVQWNRNVFKVPYGKIGISFICEQARLFQAYSDSSALESVAPYAAMIMPSLLLQRLPGKICAEELSRLLDHCLTIWLSRDLASLLQEGHVIQACLTVVLHLQIQLNVSIS